MLDNIFSLQVPDARRRCARKGAIRNYHIKALPCYTSIPGSDSIYGSRYQQSKLHVDDNIIGQEYLRKLEEKVESMETAAIDKYKRTHNELDTLFDDIDREFAVYGKTRT